MPFRLLAPAGYSPAPSICDRNRYPLRPGILRNLGRGSAAAHQSTRHSLPCCLLPAGGELTVHSGCSPGQFRLLVRTSARRSGCCGTCDYRPLMHRTTKALDGTHSTAKPSAYLHSRYAHPASITATFATTKVLTRRIARPRNPLTSTDGAKLGSRFASTNAK